MLTCTWICSCGVFHVEFFWSSRIWSTIVEISSEIPLEWSSSCLSFFRYTRLQKYWKTKTSCFVFLVFAMHLGQSSKDKCTDKSAFISWSLHLVVLNNLEPATFCLNLAVFYKKYWNCGWWLFLVAQIYLDWLICLLTLGLNSGIHLRRLHVLLKGINEDQRENSERQAGHFEPEKRARS